MAVTVEQETSFVVLDERDRIVEVGPNAESQFGPLVGALLWECFPGAEPLFKPYYDEARKSGEAVEFVQFYDGSVARIRAVPRAGRRLALDWEQLVRLDTLTIDSLAETLDEALDLLGNEAGAAQTRAARSALRVIEGGE